MSVSIEDRAAIHDLLASYDWLQNEGEGDAWADLWADDATITGLEAFNFVDIGSREGRRKIPAFSLAQFKGKQRHHHYNILVEPGGDKDTLKAKAYVTADNWTRGRRPMTFAKEYFTMARLDGKWKIKSMHVEFVYLDWLARTAIFVLQWFPMAGRKRTLS